MIVCSQTPPRATRAGFRNQLLGAALAGVVLTLLSCGTAAAHGWHNAALSTASLDEWMADVKAAIPDIVQKMQQQAGAAEISAHRGPKALQKAVDQAAGKADPESATGPPRGRRIETELTPQQRELLGRKANDCLQVMAYMDRRNIIPEEFPRFSLGAIPKYRNAAKQLMKAMGSAGATPLVGVIQNEMAGAGRLPPDLTRHRDFYNDLLEVLQHNAQAGCLSDQDLEALLQASQGRKPTSQQAFAREVQDVLLLETRDLSTLVDVASNTKSRGLKTRLAAKIREKMDEADVLELLQCQLATDNPDLKRALATRLKRATPRFSDVKHQIDEIWRLAGGDDRDVADAARRQVTIAFLQASVPDCMDRLGRGDPQLNRLIWEQLDFRIKRARTRGDVKLQAGYRADGVKVLGDSGRNLAERTAAIEFLGRLKDRRAVGPLADVLPKLPRELWPQAGRLLGDLTGEDYGPHEGDGVVEAFEAIKKWRTWSKENRQE